MKRLDLLRLLGAAFIGSARMRSQCRKPNAGFIRQGNALVLVPQPDLAVYRNGERQALGSDYTITSVQVVFQQPLGADDTFVVDVI